MQSQTGRSSFNFFDIEKETGYTNGERVIYYDERERERENMRRRTPHTRIPRVPRFLKHKKTAAAFRWWYVVCIRYTVLHVLLFKPVQMNHVDDNFSFFALSFFFIILQLSIILSRNIIWANIYPAADRHCHQVESFMMTDPIGSLFL